MFLGYAAFYMTRLSLGYAAPSMIEDPTLGLDMKGVGGLTSILPTCYGISKFASGVLGANTSPTYLLAGGLAATSLINIAFGSSSAYLWFCLLWGGNGLLQGLGAPACARIMTTWWSDTERGTVWGVWTASNNVGGFLAPMLVGNVARKFGWRYAMYAPGIVGLVFALVVLLFMKDTPENFGHAPVSTPKPKQKSADPDEKKPSMIQNLKTEVLTNPYVWLFAISYFFVYVIRQGATSWLIFYLKHKGIQDVATRVSGLELGGLAGSLSAGWLSDHLTKKNQKEGGKAGNVGLRVKVAITYTLLTAVFLFGFFVCPDISWLQWLLVAGIGFSLYGPQMLIGLCGAEAVAKNAVSSCQGFLGIISYAGAASAGVPLALLVEKFGWNAFFASLGASCILVVLLILPCVNLKSYSQKVDESNAKLA